MSVPIINLSRLKSYESLTKKGDQVFVLNRGLYIRDDKGWIQASTFGTSNTLSSLSDTSISSPSLGDVLFFNGTSWVNHQLLFENLSDIPEPTGAGQVLLSTTGASPWSYNWDIASISTLTNIGDVTPGQVANDILVWRADGDTDTWQPENPVNHYGLLNNVSLGSGTPPRGGSLSDGDTIVWDTSVGKWTNMPIGSHTHVYTDISNWNTGVYSWSNSNVSGGTKISLTFDGTGYSINSEVQYFGNLDDANIKDPNTGLGVEPVAGNTLVYVGTYDSGGKWTPGSPSITALQNIDDVDPPTITNGFLQWTGTKWVTSTVGSTHTFMSHSDVNISSTTTSWPSISGVSFAQDIIPIRSTTAWTTLNLKSLIDLYPAIASDANITGQWDFTSKRIRVQGNTTPSSGSGIELGFDLASTQGILGVYDRTGTLYSYDLILNALSVKLYKSGSERLATTTNGVSITGSLTTSSGATFGDTVNFDSGATAYVDGTTHKGYAADWIATSDMRVKKNIHSLEDWTGKIKAMSKMPVRYSWRNGFSSVKDEQIGWIAQDMLRVAPEIVEFGSAGLYGINYSKAIVPSIQVLGQTVERVETLEEKVERLECENKELRLELETIINNRILKYIL